MEDIISKKMDLTKEEVLSLIDAELQGNLMILIDPKRKDSFLNLE
jgi:hypothetical protein